jgi:hypothetical protein
MLTELLETTAARRPGAVASPGLVLRSLAGAQALARVMQRAPLRETAAA